MRKKLNHPLSLQTNIPLSALGVLLPPKRYFTSRHAKCDRQGFSTWRENCNDSDDIELPARREVDFWGEMDDREIDDRLLKKPKKLW